MPIGLAGKTAIVTGAGRGIGKAVAELFAREGARVLVVNRSPEAGQTATDAIVAEGFDASFLQADVRKKTDMERMAEVCIERYGRIDILWPECWHLPQRAHRRHDRGDVGRRDGHQPQGRVLRGPGVPAAR